MKKFLTLKNLILLIIAFALVVTAALSVTFAYFQTNMTGTGSITTATWEFTINGTMAQTFTLTPVADPNENVKNEGGITLVAPGSTGHFDITAVNNSGVKAQYTITGLTAKIGDETLSQVKFYYDAGCTNQINGGSYTFGTSDATKDGKLNFSDTETITIYWKWDAGTLDSDNGYASTISTTKSLVFTLQVQGTQIT